MQLINGCPSPWQEPSLCSYQGTVELQTVELPLWSMQHIPQRQLYSLRIGAQSMLLPGDCRAQTVELPLWSMQHRPQRQLYSLRVGCINWRPSPWQELRPQRQLYSLRVGCIDWRPSNVRFNQSPEIRTIAFCFNDFSTSDQDIHTGDFIKKVLLATSTLRDRQIVVIE